MSKSPLKVVQGLPVTDKTEPTALQTERLAQLASAQEARDGAVKEIERLHGMLEEVLSAAEAGEAKQAVRANPAAFKSSERPTLRKLAEAHSKRAAALERISEIELQLRDLQLTAPADVMVEVRALMRKQAAEFDALKTQNAELKTQNALLSQRIDELEKTMMAHMRSQALMIRSRRR
uniref:Uncharacterized protein n=1 Tax=Calcidiscus leptoporus TaxID=127549 RepID=A0A6U5DGY3_9EUKA